MLGHGGTGTVYLGERADRQYSAQVAVKIVDSGTMQGDLGLRFRAERQILASLNHPNIARLLDAGETEDGQPYLVMEYVHGEPLDRYCDRQQLDLRARLKLFLEICGAVQYAHQNLIVHRDLKPANILVTAEGSPKLLDFGIAKLLDTGEAAAAMALTRMNDRLLTPEYASPEQILGRPVTTASDVYALGVVLYELLTGLRPYTVPASASQLELERSICITDPLRPSAAVKRALESGPLEGQSEIARHRAGSQARRRRGCRSVCSATSTRSSCARCARSRSIATARSNSSPPTCGAICRASRSAPPGQLAVLLATFRASSRVRRVGRRCIHRVHRRVRDRDVDSDAAHRRRARPGAARKQTREAVSEFMLRDLRQRRSVQRPGTDGSSRRRRTLLDAGGAQGPRAT